MHVGERIRRLRERKDWSQKKLSQMVGINTSVFNRIESGERRIRDDELIKIADALDVKIESLLGKDDSSNIVNNDANTTIELIEEEARKLGLRPNDPVFKKMLKDAFELLRLARGQNNK